MAQKAGEMYYIAVTGIRLYYTSPRAATWNQTQSGWLTDTGEFKIYSVRWARNSNIYESDPGAGSVPIYAIYDKAEQNVIGWVRDDNNIGPAIISSSPSSISSTQANFSINIRKTKRTSIRFYAQVDKKTWFDYSSTSAETSAVSLTKSFSITEAVRAALHNTMPNATTATATIYLQTIQDNRVIGTRTSTFTVNIPSSIKPTFGTKPTFSLDKVVDGKIFSGNTEIYLSNTPTATPGEGATLSTSTISISNLTRVGVNRWQITNPGEAVVTYIIRDSRGRTNEEVFKRTAIAANAISISTFVAKRTGSAGARYEASGSHLQSFDGNPKYQLQRRERGVSAWSNIGGVKNTTVSGNSWTIGETVSTGFSGTKSYDVRIVVTGSSSSANATSIVGTEATVASFGMHGMGIGRQFDNSSTSMLQVGTGGIDSEGPVKVNGVAIGSLPTEIPSGANLNDYRTAGEYYLEHIPDPFNITNFPSSTGRFHLKVNLMSTGSTAIGTQILQNRASSTNTAIYFRSFFGTTFSAWKDLTEVGSGGGTPIDTSGFYSDNNPGYTYRTDPENPAIRWMRFNSGFTLSWGTVNSTSETQAISFGRQFQAMPIVTAMAYHNSYRPVLNTLTLITASNGTHYSGISFRITEAKSGAAWSGTTHGTAGIDYMVVGVS